MYISYICAYPAIKQNYHYDCMLIQFYAHSTIGECIYFFFSFFFLVEGYTLPSFEKLLLLWSLWTNDEIMLNYRKCSLFCHKDDDDDEDDDSDNGNEQDDDDDHQHHHYHYFDEQQYQNCKKYEKSEIIELQRKMGVKNIIISLKRRKDK